MNDPPDNVTGRELAGSVSADGFDWASDPSGRAFGPDTFESDVRSATE